LYVTGVVDQHREDKTAEDEGKPGDRPETKESSDSRQDSLGGRLVVYGLAAFFAFSAVDRGKTCTSFISPNFA